MNKKKIIILSYYHFPCKHPVLENVFAKEIGRRHNIVWLLQGDITNGKKRKWHNSKVIVTKALQGKQWYKKIANRIFSWQRFFQIIGLLSSEEDTIVLFRDMPFEAFLVSFLRRYFRFKLFYQHSAPLHEISITAFKVNKGSKRFWYLAQGVFFSFFIDKIMRKADIVFPISEFHKKELDYFNNGEKFVPLTMGVDEKWLERCKGEIPYLKKIGEDNFILAYFGTLSFTRNPKFILRVFDEVRKRVTNCKLIMMGKTDSDWEDRELRLTCRKLEIDKDAIFTGLLNKEELQDHLAYCYLSISAIPAERRYELSSPTKVYESLGNGVPVIGNKEIYEQKKVLSESGGGIIVDYDVASFSDAIVDLLNKPKLRQQMAQKGREYVIKKYSYHMIAKNIAPYFL